MPRQASLIHSRLRLSDLASQPTHEEKLLSIRLPVELLDRLDEAGRILHARKAEVVLAMLNEGLARYEARMGAGPRANSSKRRARPKSPNSTSAPRARRCRISRRRG